MTQNNRTIDDEPEVLLVGATGYLGSKVARIAAGRGKRLRALVREGSDATSLQGLGIQIVRGDIGDQGDLAKAMKGCEAVITTAAGYTGRRKADFSSSTDSEGQKLLAHAARIAGIHRYVFCSVLTCDKARSVPHFWHKKLAEDALRDAGVPFVALRPGAFLDQGPNHFWRDKLVKGKLQFLSDPSVPATFVHSDDVARYLVDALDIATDENALTIDISCDRAVSINEIAKIMSDLLGRSVTPNVPPWPLVSAALGGAGVFKPHLRDFAAMLRYFQKGGYLADTQLQARYFGEIPDVEASIARYLTENGFSVVQAPSQQTLDRRQLPPST